MVYLSSQWLQFKGIWRVLISVGCLYHVGSILRGYLKFQTKVDMLVEGPSDFIHAGFPNVAFSFCYRDIDTYDTATLLEMSDSGLDGYLTKTSHFTVQEIKEAGLKWRKWLQGIYDLQGNNVRYLNKSSTILDAFMDYVSNRPNNETGVLQSFWHKMQNETAIRRKKEGWSKTDPLMWLIDFTWNHLNIQESDQYLASALHNYTRSNGFMAAWNQTTWVKLDSNYEHETYIYLKFARSTDFSGITWYLDSVSIRPLSHYVWSNQKQQRYLCRTYFYVKQFGPLRNYDLISFQNQRMALAMHNTSFLSNSSHENWQLTFMADKIF